MSARDEDGDDGATEGGAGGGHDVGSLAEEAARLLGAFSRLDLEGHLATGAPECTVCPVCRTLRALRGLSPEVTGHLAAAATSLAQALAALRTTHADAGSPRRGAGVEHIDLDGAEDDAADWTDEEP